MPSDTSNVDASLRLESVPSVLTEGATVLVGCVGDPAQHALTLRLLCQVGQAPDSGVVITTTTSATQTVEDYDAVCPAEDRPDIALVDTVSTQQSVSAPYDDPPIVYTPAVNDLERVITALAELTSEHPPPDGERHLLVSSLTPVIEETSEDHFYRALDRITGLRTDGGLCALGVDHTAHSTETINRLAGLVDGLLWITREDSRLVCEYSPSRSRHR